jgi:hypothetical protein
MDVAVQTGEDPRLLTKRTDVGRMLEKMKEGVVITLHVSRPRFWSRLTLDDLGLGQRAISAQATDIINAYFQLGRRSLLPKRYQDQLGSAESSARSCLARSAFKSHWGFFVPLTRYQAWKEDNSRLEAEFWAVKDEILSNYDAIIEEVVDDHRPLAEDAWRRLLVGTAVYEQEKLPSTTTALLAEVVEHLRAGHGKETFVENYLKCIRAAMPQLYEIEDGFEYRVERGVIPLPSLLARGMEQADRVYQECAVQDAQTQARLAAIETQRRADMQKLTLQQQQEREEHYHRLQLDEDASSSNWKWNRMSCVMLVGKRSAWCRSFISTLCSTSIASSFRCQTTCYRAGKCPDKWFWHTLGDAYLLFGLRDRSTEDQKNCRRIA